MFVTFIDTRLLSLLRLLVRLSFVLPTSGGNFWEEKGRKYWSIFAESIYHCMLLIFDHILYRRAHYVHDARRVLRAVLTII